MPLPARPFARDEELGKKSDDHRSATNGAAAVAGMAWVKWNAAPRMRRRRWLAIVVVLVCLYFFFKNMPEGLLPVPLRVDRRVPGQTIGGKPLRGSSRFIPSTAQDTSAQQAAIPNSGAVSSSTIPPETYSYSGPVRYQWLGPSLHAISRTQGHRDANKNILFVAATPEAASRLIPLACDMSNWNRNTVHFAIIGRDNVPLQEIMKRNGVDSECDVYWHDARSDRSRESTDTRMHEAVRGALEHIWSFMHPQAYIIDAADSSVPYFIDPLRQKTRATQRTLIKLPGDAVQRMMWFTRLDTGSLRAWHDTQVEILIQAPTDGSGSLTRLFNSIEQADYAGFMQPHITVELPPIVPKGTLSYLQRFSWPRMDKTRTGGISIRHRISTAHLDPIEASVRFFESFYPSRPANSHVLILSPNVELSPLYYHYLMYHILEYRYSSYFSGNLEREGLMGISLSLPTTNLDGETAFTPPRAPMEVTETDEQIPAESKITSFLWQAPNPHAALVFGVKWTELHDFCSRRLLISPNAEARAKLVTRAYPSWTEYILELMQARGYTFLYPGLQPSTAMATVHNELYRPPEEYTTPPPAPKSDPDSPPIISDSYLVPPMQAQQIAEEETPLARTPLVALLPKMGDLPELSSLPLLGTFGRMATPDKAIRAAKGFAERFRMEIGGCTRGTFDDGKIQRGSAEDLFCLKQFSAGLAPPATAKSVSVNAKGGAAVAKGVQALGTDWKASAAAQAVDEKTEKAMYNEFLQHLDRQSNAS